jgi:hypothetical protein
MFRSRHRRRRNEPTDSSCLIRAAIEHSSLAMVSHAATGRALPLTLICQSTTIAPSGGWPVCRYCQSWISSLRPRATMPILRCRLEPWAKRRSYHRVGKGVGSHILAFETFRGLPRGRRVDPSSSRVAMRFTQPVSPYGRPRCREKNGIKGGLDKRGSGVFD